MTNTTPLKDTIQVEYRFTPDEKTDLSITLVRLLRELDEIEEQKKGAMADYKFRAEGRNISIRSIMSKLQTGSEMRALEALIEFDTEKSERIYIHPGTHEEIRREQMTQSDWQLFRPQPDGTEAPAIPKSTVVYDEDSGKPLPTSDFTPGGEDAGYTNIADAMDAAVAQTEQPKILIVDLGTKDWEPAGLRKAFRTAAKKAEWSVAAISLLDDQLAAIDKDQPDQAEAVNAMRATLAPHVV